MAFIERAVNQVHSGKWAELEEWEKKWDALEERIGGCPKKRRYRPYVGGDGWSTYVWEREWESYAAMETAILRLFEEPEARALGAEMDSMVANMRREHYFILDW
jgi:hypothetical protein